jgi:ABC-2 type transport system permease protein
MRSQIAAMLLVLVITVMPSLLFSGLIYPIFNMPKFFQIYTYLFPARYFVEISRDIMLKGNGIREMLSNIVMLLIYTVVIITLASLRFKKKLD